MSHLVRLEQYREGQHGPCAGNAHVSALSVHIWACPVQFRAHQLIFVRAVLCSSAA